MYEWIFHLNSLNASEKCEVIINVIFFLIKSNLNIKLSYEIIKDAKGNNI